MKRFTLLTLCLALGCNFAIAKEKRSHKPKKEPVAAPVPPPSPAEVHVPPPVPAPVPPQGPQGQIPQPPVPQPVMNDPSGARVVTPGIPRRGPLRRGPQPGVAGQPNNLPQDGRRILPQNPPPPIQPVPPPLPVPAQAEIVQVSPNAGIFNFTNDTHGFGIIPEGNPVEWDFEFTNTGKEPIVIKEARASCGCTTPSFPKEPIKPGGTGKIHVVYNTKGRPGVFNKEVTIISNARQQPMVLHIGGEVKQ